MSSYKKKNPDKAKQVDKMVSSGVKAREMYGAANVNTEEMTMDEYKSYITDILDKIPFDVTHPYDEETIYISEDGWEQMKNDPDYEAWVLGYNVENRSVKNPFFVMGDMGSFCVEHFGASIESHHGVSYSKVYGGTAQGARSMFESQSSGKGAIRKKAPQADAKPPKNWSLEEERKKSKKKKYNDIWDELFEKQVRYRRQINDELNLEYVDNITLDHLRLLRDSNDNTFSMEV